MSGEGEVANLNEVRVVTEISNLPPLPENSVRAVHFTHPELKDKLLNDGLKYEKYGMAMSMARAWGNADNVKYWTDDPRYSFEGVRALVMDMSNEEWRLHNNVTKCPGTIPKERIVGFVEGKKPDTSS